MKKTYIIAILVIAAAIALIISTAGDASTYVTFQEAKKMSEEGNHDKIHIVGKLPKNKDGIIEGLELNEDHLSFSFLLVDQNNESQRVFYYEPIPVDFHKSEQIVIIGSYKKDKFIAKKILLKCPSKYQNEKLQQAIILLL